MRAFFESVRKYRRARKMTQSDLADLMGTTQAVVSMIESGAGNPKSDTIETLADALGVDILIVPKSATKQVLALIASLEAPGKKIGDGSSLTVFDDVFDGDDGSEFEEEDARRNESYGGHQP